MSGIMYPPALKLVGGATGAALGAAGATAQRPSSGVAGQFRFNTQTLQWEFGHGGSWKNFLLLDGGELSGALTLHDDPTDDLHAATKRYVDAQSGDATLALTTAQAALPKAGGTLTGLLTLSDDPTANLHAATKQYADGKLALTGGKMTGSLALTDGTTAQRSTSVKGDLRFNTTNNQPEFAELNGSVPVPVGTRIARAQHTGAMRSWDITGFTSSTQAMAVTDAYSGATGRWGGALLDWDGNSSATDDGITVLKPNSISSGAGRWIKRLPAWVVLAEDAGAMGDYVFPSSGSGEVLGQDNTSSITNACNTVGYAASLHKGGTVQLRAAAYRVTGTLNIPPGARLRGIQGLPYALASTSRFNTGSVIVLDGVDACVKLGQGAVLENVRIMRRGMDLAPSSSDVDTYWAARLDEVCAGQQWKPDTVYSAGDVVVNYNQVYKCDTGGTSGAITTGGPRSQRVASDAITDGTATWHWINEYTWYRSKAVVAGAVMCAGNKVYKCDTAGTTSSTGNGPTATTTGTNSITDGTAKWHYLGSFGFALTTADYCNLENVSIVGFSKGISSMTGMNLRNVWVDAIHCVDICNSGDVSIYERVLCRAQYHVSGATRRRHGYGIYLHDRMDTTIIRASGAQLWAVGMCLSNVWPMVQDCCVETDTTTNGDTCCQLLGIITGGQFHHNYFGGILSWHIAATDLDHNPNPVSGWSTAQSQIEIVGGWYGATAQGVGTWQTGMWPSAAFYIEGQARGAIRDGLINQQGQAVFQCPATTDTTNYFWTVRDMTVLSANILEFSDLATIDSSVASFLHWDNVWHAERNRPLVQTAHDSTIDNVASPTSGGSHTVANGVKWCFIANGSTLASYTVTMPSAPYDGQEVEVTAQSAITSLTVTSAANAPSSMVAGGTARFKYRSATSTWYHLVAA